jgi:hypothetical protein
MLSALITAFPAKLGGAAPDPVIRTLGALVPAAVAGLIADVALVGPADVADLSAIADHAGCQLLVCQSEGEALRLGLMACRRERALVIRAGYIPGSGFLEELADLLGPGAGAFRAAILRERPDGLFSLAARRRVAAIVARKDALLRLHPSGFDRMASRARPDRKLKCGALRIG